MVSKQMKLGVFLMGAGHHIGAWRHPNAAPDAFESIDFYKHVAQVAENGKLDMLFISDALSLTEKSHPSELVRFEPLTLISALSQATEKIGLAATASTTYNEPFHLARKFASIDHLSKGRAAWNIVTSYYEDEAKNFGEQRHPSHAERYGRAEEFIDVVGKLWNSWQKDALIRDRESGIYFDREKVQTPDHKGEHFSVRGPLNASALPQTKPVLIQAGSSSYGTAFAARHAEVVFTAQQTLADGQRFYKSLKEKVSQAGRNPEKVLIMPGISPITADTKEDAEAIYEELQELLDENISLAFLSDYLGGMSFSEDQLDAQLPEDIPETNGNRSRRDLIVDLARREQLTVRELAKRVAGSRGHHIVCGSPEEIADTLELWFREKGCDGFNLMFPYYPTLMETFVDQVVPILQKRGLFRREYEGTTLRDHLELSLQTAQPVT